MLDGTRSHSDVELALISIFIALKRGFALFNELREASLYTLSFSQLSFDNAIE